MIAEQLTDPVAYHGEGPVWSDQWGGLRWVDMLAGDILSLDSSGTIGRRNVGVIAAVVRPRRGGGAVIGVERGFALEDADGSHRTLPQVWSSTAIRMNEGGCDPDGRFYCGSMAYEQTPGAATLYRLDVDGSVSAVVEQVTISNGLEWSPDGSLAYYVDTPTHRVDVFDYDRSGGLSNRRSFVTVPAADGLPDGLTVDADGGVWVALNQGGRVHRYTADGRLDEVVEVGARQVTACTIGGEHLKTLYITTSREGLDAGDDVLAGSLFSVQTVPTGLPVRAYGG